MARLARLHRCFSRPAGPPVTPQQSHGFRDHKIVFKKDSSVGCLDDRNEVLDAGVSCAGSNAKAAPVPGPAMPFNVSVIDEGAAVQDRCALTAA